MAGDAAGCLHQWSSTLVFRTHSPVCFRCFLAPTHGSNEWSLSSFCRAGDVQNIKDIGPRGPGFKNTSLHDIFFLLCHLNTRMKLIQECPGRFHLWATSWVPSTWWWNVFGNVRICFHASEIHFFIFMLNLMYILWHDLLPSRPIDKLYFFKRAYNFNHHDLLHFWTWSYLKY